MIAHGFGKTDKLGVDDETGWQMWPLIIETRDGPLSEWMQVLIPHPHRPEIEPGQIITLDLYISYSGSHRGRSKITGGTVAWIGRNLRVPGQVLASV